MLKQFNLLSLKIDLFSIIAVLVNCIAINIYAYEFKIDEVNIIFNAAIISYVLSLVSLFAYYMQHIFNKKTVAVLWLVSVIYGIGFLPAYIVLITSGKKYLIFNLSSSLLLLAMMTEWLMFMMISIIGMTSAFIMYNITHSNEISFFQSDKQIYFIYYIILYTFITMSLSMKNKERIQEKRMDFMKVFGSAIAHEVNAPLSSMKMMSDVLELIIDGAEVKKKSKHYIMVVNEMDYEMLTTIKTNLKNVSNDAIQIVEMLLAALREKYTDKTATGKMSVIVEAAIELASHLNINGKRISLKIDNDFVIKGNVKLLKHVIYNLIKNSFKHGGDNVSVLIEIKHDEVIVSDNGVGIPKDEINYLFNAFFTNGNGNGIGLAFAKFVLDDINANINCESELGKFTRFNIKFNSF